MDRDQNVWEQWDGLLNAETPDVLAILKLGAQLQAYFAAVERETLMVARARGLTWAQLGEALGTSRQAVWQRATTPSAMSRKRPSKANPPLNDENYAFLQKAREDLMASGDRIAGEMFDSPTAVSGRMRGTRAGG